MKFAEAFSAMKSGAKVKLPSWAGYWDWDPEKETILMHCTFTKGRKWSTVKLKDAVEREKYKWI